MKRIAIPLVCLTTFLLAVSAPVAAAPQQANLVYDVQYSVPFGVVSGTLMMLGDYVVFMDSDKPESSFVIPRQRIAAMTVDGAMINLDTTVAIDDRDGQRTQFAFRLPEGVASGPIVQWHSAKGVSSDSTLLVASVSGPDAAAVEMAYTVKHDHRFGSCRGQLILRGDVLAYESIDKLDHSRRWELHQIEEIIKRNPYELKVEPFEGGDYTLKLQGRGIEPAEFEALRDRVTMARALR